MGLKREIGGEGEGEVEGWKKRGGKVGWGGVENRKNKTTMAIVRKTMKYDDHSSISLVFFIFLNVFPKGFKITASNI